MGRLVSKFVSRLQYALSQLSRTSRTWILVAFDFITLSGAVWVSYCLRVGEWVLPNPDQLSLIVAAPIVALPVFLTSGLYRSVIRYLPEQAFWTMAKSVVISTLLWVGVLFAFEISRQGTMPRSVPAIYCIIAILTVVGSRFAAKYVLWEPSRRQFGSTTVIYGAGSAGAQLATALMREGSKFIVGFIDDDPGLLGRDVAGLRVYSPAQIPDLISTQGLSEVVISIPSIDKNRRQKIIADLSIHQLKIRTLPALADLASGRYLISQIREINIDDILGRSSVPPDTELLDKMIHGRSVLVSGAGGSIGSELCNLVAKWRPRHLVLFETNEFALYQIERELKKRVSIPIIPILGSVCDEPLLQRSFRSYGVQVVFHTAAYKHVPLVEANILEGIKNNVFGTRAIAAAAYNTGVEHFVLISTDKAVHPSNIMGATKRFAELITHDFAKRAAQSKTGQKFCTVRFGNVLGSNGSVVPLFTEQIAGGGPVTVTDNQMTRYFMSIHEAAELIVQSAALSVGGDTFLLEMGKPIRIRDLAENMIRLAGLTVRSTDYPDGDILIETIGRRPGEKIHEELFYDPETVGQTKHPKILVAPRNTKTNTSPDSYLMELERVSNEFEEMAARRILFDGIEMEKSSDAVVQLEIVNKNS